MPANIREKSKKYDYVEIVNFENMPTIRLAHRSDFIQMLEDRGIHTIYLKSYNSDGIIGLSDFIIYDQGATFLTYGYGYRSLEDMSDGSKLGFGGSSEKYGMYEEKLTKRDGYGHADKISDGYLYYSVKELGYKDFKEFEDSYAREFYQNEVPIDEYRQARKLGFKGYEQYSSFKESDFKNVSDYFEASNLDIQDSSLYDIYTQLNVMQKKLSLESHDQVLLYAIISSSSERSLALDTLAERFRELEHPLPGPHYDSMRWYTRKYDGGVPTRIGKDLSTSEAFNGLGKYDGDNKIFNKFIGVPVFLDGSNVAYNNGSSEKGDKPLARYLQIVIEEAKKYGFSDIRIYHDANLDYLVDDVELLNRLRKEYRVEKVPAKTDADEFIIPLAKKHEAFIITSDQFRDYAEAHKEDENFINSHRLAFMIDDGQVVFNNSKYIANAKGVSSKDFDDLRNLLLNYDDGRRGSQWRR